MNWFKEDIGKAINESKTKGLIFLVYAFDSNSSETTELWNRDTIFQTCNKNCISLQLEAQTETCNQFMQIYKIDSFPTTYFIGNNGQTLEVITGNVTENELIAKIEIAIQAHELSKAATSSSNEAAAATTSQTSSLDERVALARQKVKLLQEKKMQIEKENEKNSEMERRQVGQDILKNKREREEQELKRIGDQKKKEKLDDQLAKQRIMERIAQDREDKQKKFSAEKEEQSKQTQGEKAKQEQLRQENFLAEAARNSKIARIQFRFVDGSSCVSQFEPSQNLEDARLFVAQKLLEMSGNQVFTMHSSFPKREYTAQDMSSTLQDLQLCPTATLLIIPTRLPLSKISKTLGSYLPSTSSSSSSSSSSGDNSSSLMSYTRDIMSFIFLPITIIWGLIGGLFGLTGQPSSSVNTNTTGSSNRGQSSASQAPRESVRGNARIRQINDGKDDDDNATYNGNSTQQM